MNRLYLRCAWLVVRLSLVWLVIAILVSDARRFPGGGARATTAGRGQQAAPAGRSDYRRENLGASHRVRSSRPLTNP